MKTELFIFKKDDLLNTILNTNFKGGVDGYVDSVNNIGAIPADWNLVLGGETSSWASGVFYPSGSSFNFYSQSNILKGAGKVKVSFTITEPEDGSTLTGSMQAGFGFERITGSSVGEHSGTLELDGSDVDLIFVNGTGTFNGGITNIVVEVVSGTWCNIDLFNDVSIPLTFNISDIEDIASKKGSYSKTITLPGTAPNNGTFGYINDINSANEINFNDSFECYMLSKTNVVFKGVFTLEKATKVKDKIEYEGTVYSQSVGLFDTIGDKLLRNNTTEEFDLDFSEYNHILSKEFINNTWFLGTNGEGVVYVPINKDAREQSWFDDANTFNTDRMTASLFVKQIIDKIFEKAGYSYDSDFFNSDYFKKLICPHSDFSLRILSEDAARDDFVGDSGLIGTTAFNYTDLSNDVYTTPGVSIETDSAKLPFSLISQGDNLPFDDSNDEYIAQAAGIFDINIELQADFGLKAVNSDGSTETGDWILSTGETEVQNNQVKMEDSYRLGVQLIRYRGTTETVLAENIVSKEEYPDGGAIGYTFYMNGLFSDPTQTSGNPIISQNFVFNLKDQHIVAGDKLYIKWFQDLPVAPSMWDAANPVGVGNAWFWRLAGGTNQFMDVSFTIQKTTGSDSLFEVTKSNVLTEGNTIKCTELLHGTTKQSDFLSSIFKMFNLYVSEIGDKLLKIEPRDDFYSNDLDDVNDWTNKVDRSQVIEIERGSSLDEKVTYLHYDDGETVLENAYKETEEGHLYGEYYKINENNKDLSKKEEVKIIFAAAPSDGINPNSHNIPAYYKGDSSNRVDETATLKPIILFWNGIRDISDPTSLYPFIVKSKTDDSTITLYGEFPFVGHFTDPYIQDSDTQDLMFGTNPNKYYIQDRFGTGNWATPNNLFNNFYNQQINELLTSKYVSAYIHLNESDIADFDFAKIVFIDDTYYRVIKINEWLPDQPAKVELLKVTTIEFDSEVVKPLYDYDDKEPTSTKPPEPTDSTDSGTFTEVGVMLKSTNDEVYAVKSNSELIKLAQAENTEISNLTHTELLVKIAANELSAGKLYTINDFRTSFNYVSESSATPVVISEDIGFTERLTVIATSPSTLSPFAYSAAYPNDVIEYNANPPSTGTNSWYYTSGVQNANLKGIITYRKDSDGNEADYDTRNVKFRRWALNHSTWDAVTNYSQWAVVQYSGSVYFAPVAIASGGSAPPASGWVLLYDNLYQSWRNDSLTIGRFVINVNSADYQDSLTFGAGCYNNNLGKSNNRLNNIIFGLGCYNNIFFRDNSRMNFGDYNHSNTFNCLNNIMTFGNSNYRNTFGNSNSSNVFGGSNHSNIFKSFNYWNTFGNLSFNNTFDYSNYKNTFTDALINNIFRCENMNTLNFLLSTHVYGSYNCEVVARADGTPRLKYINNSDVMVVVAPTT